MKELSERSQYVDYMSGKQMSASEFNEGALDIFSKYVWEDVKREHCGRQLDLEGEVWYTKSRPVKVKTPQQERLSEVRPLKNGITRVVKLPIEELVPMLRDFERRMNE